MCLAILRCLITAAAAAAAAALLLPQVIIKGIMRVVP
jgi:hypothetical protein